MQVVGSGCDEEDVRKEEEEVGVRVEEVTAGVDVRASAVEVEDGG